MANIQDLINLAKADGGKFFVIDETGEPKLVILSVEDYEKLLIGKMQREDQNIEEINREILEAQIKEDLSVAAPNPPRAPRVETRQDLREEVIDPSFDFEGPKVDLEDI